jgi:hypothetical protein
MAALNGTGKPPLVYMEITRFVCLALKYFANSFVEICCSLTSFAFIGKNYMQEKIFVGVLYLDLINE